MRVVVVDDDEDVREATVMLLEVLGHEASGHGVPEEGLRAAAGADVVLQDLHIPGMMIEEQLQRMGALPHPPGVVLFSASIDVHSLHRIPGAAAVLPKPFTTEALEAALARAAAGRS